MGSLVKLRVIDMSYGNLRVVDNNGNTLVLDKDELEKLLSNIPFTTEQTRKQKYPHLKLPA
jgi:hypothetical protein